MALFQKLYKLETRQFLPISVDEAWAFFSSPDNLSAITPDHMGFEIRSHLGKDMYPGMLINYIVKPILGLRMRWCTEITYVEKHKYFVDEQRFGPYRIWHHEHHFERVEDGIEMTDIVHYGLPFGILGRWSNRFFVRRQLQNIFEYRFKAIQAKWPLQYVQGNQQNPVVFTSI